MPIDFAQVNPLTDAIIGAAIKVHKGLGPGLLESAYQACLLFELHRLDLAVISDLRLPIVYESVRIDCGYTIDLVVGDLVVVELKSVRALAPIHTAQLLTYLKLTGCPAGLLLNFNVPVLKAGIRRLLNAQATKGITA